MGRKYFSKETIVVVETSGRTGVVAASDFYAQKAAVVFDGATGPEVVAIETLRKATEEEIEARRSADRGPTKVALRDARRLPSAR